MAVQVFISHSTGAKAGREPVASHTKLLRKVIGRLEGEGFNVLVDADIPPGDHWRDRLFGRLDECNAAVVLINNQALFHSPWVDFEVKILGWRAWIERRNFRLIVVPFGGVTRRQIEEHMAWEAIAPGEVQMIPSGDAGLDISDRAAVDAALGKIVEVLRTLPERSAQGSVYGWLVDKISGLLKLEKETLEQIADELRVPRSHSPNRMKQQIARQLYRSGPTAIRTLMETPGVTIPKDDLRAILEILNTSWVDPSASTTILKYRRLSEVKQKFAINGSRASFTPRAYVRQVCCWLDPWAVIPVTDKSAPEEIIAQVREGLKTSFKYALDDSGVTEETMDEYLNSLLVGLLRVHGAPVFVALSPTAALDEDLVEAIHATYQNLRVILCTGTTRGSPPPHDVVMLEPEIDLQDEAEAWEVYFSTRGVLR